MTDLAIRSRAKALRHAAFDVDPSLASMEMDGFLNDALILPMMQGLSDQAALDVAADRFEAEAERREALAEPWLEMANILRDLLVQFPVP